MKKSLLLLAVATFGVVSAQAQSRFSLYEEFSGENCGPCAAYNPSVWALAKANASNVMLIKYQSPIPTAGPIYNQYKTVTNARLAYYGINGAPTGNLNGLEVTGHVANFTQNAITTAAGATTPFTMTVSHVYNTTLDSFIATVNITASGVYSGTTLKLRVALIEDLEFSRAPGTNGEREFHHVVRDMYPDATGITIPNSWTVAQTQTVTVKGRIPSYVDRADANVVVWIQDDATKSIPQAAKSTTVLVPNDGAVVAATNSFACGLTGSTATSTFTLRNAGTTPMTSAKIFYRPSGGTWASMNWTGTLAPGATTSVTTPQVTVSSANQMILDSVGEVNGVMDQNLPNNRYETYMSYVDNTPKQLPLKTGFEAAAFPANYVSFDPSAAGYPWVNGSGGPNTFLARAGSNYMPWYRVGAMPAGIVGYLFLPTPAAGSVRTLDFWHAYAQRTAANNDKLEVVYSTDCGTNWTAIFNKAGAALATADPAGNTNWLPSPAEETTDWHQNMISLNQVPANAIIAFRATSGGGANMFLDDVEISSRALGVAETILPASVRVSPNPARGAATLQLSLVKAGTVSINVIDATGRTVAIVHNGPLAAGNQQLPISTEKLASGIYTIAIHSADVNLTQQLSVVK